MLVIKHKLENSFSDYESTAFECCCDLIACQLCLPLSKLLLFRSKGLICVCYITPFKPTNIDYLYRCH
ncbi:unnamed protein product [Heterobilharzia americana]|nr:unnamed protein product [Heterobilharzia americana]